MKLPRFLIALAIVTFGFSAPAARAVDPPWQRVLHVGEIDQSQDDLNVLPIEEFVARYDGLPQPLTAEAWPQIHPGSQDVWAGSKDYELSIRVPTRHKEGTYRIRVGLLGAHPIYPPRMRISLGNAAAWLLQTTPGADISRQTSRLEANSPQVIEYLINGEDLPENETLLTIRSEGDSSWAVYDGIAVDWSDQPLLPQVDVALDAKSAMLVERSGEGERQKLGLTLNLHGVATPLHIRVVDAKGEVWADATLGPSASKTPFYGPLTAEFMIPARRETQSLSVELQSENIHQSLALAWPGYRPLELFIVPESHFDNGYTATQETAVAHNVESLTRAIGYADRFDNFSWTNESSYILQRWLQTAAPADQERLVWHIRDGKIGLDAGWVNMLTGLCTEEELFRWLYWSGNFARKHDLPLSSATITDAPSHVWSLPTILKSSGVDFLSIGSNPDRAAFWRFGAERAYQPVWWEGPDGSRLLTLIHRHYADATSVGVTLSLEQAESQLPAWLSAMYNPADGTSYPYDVVHLHGAYVDNRQLEQNLPEVVAQWNAKYQWPRITLGTNAQFFARLRKEALQKAPVVRGDQGAYWEDGAASSARETTLNRLNVRRVAALEMLLASLHAQGRLRDYPQQLLDDAWQNALLYDEHTWGAWNSISQPDDATARTEFDVKAGFALKASAACDRLQRIVAVELPELSALESAVPEAVAPSADSLCLQSQELAVEVDEQTGFISSLRRLSDDREFIEASAPESRAEPGFGQVLYDAKARSSWPSAHDRAVGSQRTSPTLVDVRRAPRAIVSRFKHEILGIVELETALASDSPTVFCTLRIRGKTAVASLEGVYLAFPFALVHPTIDYEVGGAVVRAGRDWMPHACLDWFSVQDFVRLADPATDDAVVWSSPDAPLVSFQDVNTHKDLAELPIDNGRIYSYVMNNYWHTNYVDRQGGDFEFRYRFTIGRAPSLAECSRWARRWSPAALRTLDSFIEVRTKNVKLVAFKRSEDETGYVIRLREMDGQEGEVAIDVQAFANHRVRKVTVVDSLEGELASPSAMPVVEGLRIRTKMQPFEIQTLLVTLDDAQKMPSGAQ